MESINQSLPALLILRYDNFTRCRFTTTHDPILIFLSTFLLVFAIFGIVGNCLLFAVLRDAHLLHKNVRFSLASMTLATTIICLCLVGRCVFNLLMMTNDLGWPAISARTCAFLEMPALSSACVLCFSILVFGAERLHATWIRQTAEQLSRWLVCMIISLWLLVFFNAALVILSTEVDQTLCYCHVLLCYKWWIIAATMAFYFITEIVSLFLYFAVYRWNRTRLTSFGINSATHSLSERFQIANTIRATETLLPIVILHGFCGSALQLASYYPRTQYVRHGPTPSVVYSVLLVTSIALVYSAMHPYLTIWKGDDLQRALKRLLDRSLRRFGIWSRFQSRNNGTISSASARLVNGSEIALAVSPVEEQPETAPTGTGRAREMSLLSSVGTSEAFSGAGSVREMSSGGGKNEHESRHLKPDRDISASRKGKRKKSPNARVIRTRNFKMTPEQHCQLLEKYWE